MLIFVTIVKVVEPSIFQLGIMYSIRIILYQASLAFTIVLQKLQADYYGNRFAARMMMNDDVMMMMMMMM